MYRIVLGKVSVLSAGELPAAMTSSLSVSQCQIDTLSLAVCTPTPFTLTADAVHRL